MTAGLPGTGIGGLFYILLSFFMPIFHAQRMFKGEHKPHHFKAGVFAILLSVGILLSLYGEAKLLTYFFNRIEILNLFTIQTTALSNSSVLSENRVAAAIIPALAAMPFFILLLLLAFLQLLRFLLYGFSQKTKNQISDSVTIFDNNTAANCDKIL